MKIPPRAIYTYIDIHTTDTIRAFLHIDDAACFEQPTELLSTVGGEPFAIEVILAFPQARAVRGRSHVANELSDALPWDVAFLGNSLGS